MAQWRLQIEKIPNAAGLEILALIWRYVQWLLSILVLYPHRTITMTTFDNIKLPSYFYIIFRTGPPDVPIVPVQILGNFTVYTRYFQFWSQTLSLHQMISRFEPLNLLKFFHFRRACFRILKVVISLVIIILRGHLGENCSAGFGTKRST